MRSNTLLIITIVIVLLFSGCISSTSPTLNESPVQTTLPHIDSPDQIIGVWQHSDDTAYRFYPDGNYTWFYRNLSYKNGTWVAHRENYTWVNIGNNTYVTRHSENRINVINLYKEYGIDYLKEEGGFKIYKISSDPRSAISYET